MILDPWVRIVLVSPWPVELSRNDEGEHLDVSGKAKMELWGLPRRLTLRAGIAGELV